MKNWRKNTPVKPQKVVLLVLVVEQIIHLLGLWICEV